MQSTIYSMIVNALVALWPKLEPVVAAALFTVIRKGLLALKAKTVPDSSPFKPLEGIADEVIDQILAALPAAPAGLPSV